MSEATWSHYADTVVEFTTARGARTLDLRTAVNDDDRASLAALGLGRPFAVVTAYRADAAPEAAARATAALRDALHARESLLATTVARSPNGTHAEPGFACALPRDAAVAFGREYGQDAIFWYDGQRVWIVAACATHPDTPLPPLHAPGAAGLPSAGA